MAMVKQSVRSDGKTLVDKVADAIGQGIKTGLFVPGQRLVEADLTKQFEVSRGPLREALRRLASDGLVTIEPNRGAFIRKLTPENVSEIFAVREYLEGLAARLAASRIGHKGYRTRFKAAMKTMQQTDTIADPTSYMEANEKFHDLIVEMSGNQYLENILPHLRVPMFRYQYYRFIDVQSKKLSMSQHEEIAAAILGGDPAKSERAMRKHIRRGATHVVSLTKGTAL